MKPKPEISIAVEAPRRHDVIALVRTLDSYHQSLYPPEANHHLDIEALCAPDVKFLVARKGGDPIGIGALWLRKDLGFGEIKRMFVRPEARGFGLGAQLLAQIEQIAREHGIEQLMLETGTLNDDAHKLYQRAGFARRGPFADYPDHPFSVFMEKRLGR